MRNQKIQKLVENIVDRVEEGLNEAITEEMYNWEKDTECELLYPLVVKEFAKRTALSYKK